MFERDDKFHRDVLACTDELKAQLPALLNRYPPVVVAAALATHVSGALRVLMELGACTPDSAREILRCLEQRAFDDGGCVDDRRTAS